MSGAKGMIRRTSAHDAAYAAIARTARTGRIARTARDQKAVPPIVETPTEATPHKRRQIACHALTSLGNSDQQRNQIPLVGYVRCSRAAESD